MRMPTNTETGEPPPDPSAYSKAEDYVRDRLAESDTPLSASDIAEEYGCTNGHIRGCLNAMRKSGTVERVSRGLYQMVANAETNSDTGLDADSSAEDTSSGGDDDQPEDTDGNAGPTAEEYEAQREAVETDDDDSEDDETAHSDNADDPDDNVIDVDTAGGDDVVDVDVEEGVEEGQVAFAFLALGALAIIVALADHYLLNDPDPEPAETEDTDGETDTEQQTQATQTAGSKPFDAVMEM